MPLVALVNGSRVESWELDSAQWADLKTAYRRSSLTMSCGQPGIPKTSRLGTQFFAHKAAANCLMHEGGPETPEHLRAKALVAQAARSIGWTATVEYPAADRAWIADVLVEHAGRRIAIEVQWSTQSNADFLRRQARYETAGLECFWLAGPKNMMNVDGLPSYPFSGTIDSLEVTLPGFHRVERRELGAGIVSILSGEIADRAEAIITSLVLDTAMAKCWRDDCKKWMTYWRIVAFNTETRCGGKSTTWSSMVHQPWLDRPVETRLQRQVLEAANTSSLPSFATYHHRYSKLADEQYDALICPWCHIVQGDGFVEQSRKWTSYSVVARMRVSGRSRLSAVRHVCLDSGRGRCVPQPAIGPVDDGLGSRWISSPNY